MSDTWNRVINGFVVQEYEDQKCISQDFKYEDHGVEYEDDFGNPIDDKLNYDYQSVELIQPKSISQKKVFLGGTCDNTNWRDELIPELKKNNINYFNPVVEDWTEDCIDEEYRQKDYECDIHLYVINKNIKGVFSISEMFDSLLNNYGKYSIFYLYEKDFDDMKMLKSLIETGKLFEKRNGIFIRNNEFIPKLIIDKINELS